MENDHGEAHPKIELRAGITELRQDTQDTRQTEDELITEKLITAFAVQTEEIRLLRKKVELLVTLVTALTSNI